MFGEERVKQGRIEPGGIAEGIVGGVFRGDAEVERGVTKREAEIDQQCALRGALGGFLGHGEGKTAGNRGDTGAALGAEKYQQPSASLLHGVNSLTEESRGPNQRLGHGALVEGRIEILASAGAHATDHQFLIGHRRIDHYGGRVLDADALHQFQGVFRIAVKVNDDDVECVLQKPGHIIKGGRISGELTDFSATTFCQSAGHSPAPLGIRADQRNRQEFGSNGVGIIRIEIRC